MPDDGEFITGLLPDEAAYLRDEAAEGGRCPRCRHLYLFHHYAGGTSDCVICDCEI